MSLTLSGATAVVIGGGGGIGRGIAMGLGRVGCNVMVADIDPESSNAVATEVRAVGGCAVAAAVDSTNVDSLSALAEATEAEFGGVNLLVNLVGVITNRRLDEASEQEWAWFLEFNVMAHVRANNVFLPYLRLNAPSAHIVNTSSMAGLLALGPEVVGGFNNGLYTTTKHALIGYCAMLRMELEPEGIGVSVLCPGLVAGDLSATSARHRPDRFGGPVDNPRAGAGPNPAAMPNEQVGPILARAIEHNRFLIFTHENSGPLMTSRYDEFMDDLDFLRKG